MTGRGHFALILHAHLPFVRHPEHEDFFEEDWLSEAITESYIPLLFMMQRLLDEGVAFKLTMSITPTLCAMLRDPLLQARYVRYLDRAIDLSQREVERNRDCEELRALSEFYLARFTECRQRFVEEWKCDLVSGFRAIRETGALELIASAATHGLLPLLQNSPSAVRGQILIGCDIFREMFGVAPEGFWLPECAYSPDLDEILQEANLRWFVLDTHGLMFGNPPPRHAIYAPCFTSAGPAAFARDGVSSRQVWSAHEGYPGAPAYRDFYRDIGFDLPAEHLRLKSDENRPRRFTGIKYHRVTGSSDEKELYVRADAERTAETHAEDFLQRRREQLQESRDFNAEPIFVAPFDAELFGHWWFEGPRFLDQFLRKISRADDFTLTSPSEYLAQFPSQQIVAPATSSWGDQGYFEVWLDKSNSWIYPHLHAAARRMHDLAQKNFTQENAATERTLRQLARELLLAQASDWAFLMKTGTAREYATKRTTDHLLRFNRLHDDFVANSVDENFLSECEMRDNLFANVNWRHYA